MGRVLLAHREQAGLSQRQLAALVGMSHSYVSLLEADRHSPSVDTLCKLARALKVDARDLLVCPPVEVP